MAARYALDPLARPPCLSRPSMSKTRSPNSRSARWCATGFPFAASCSTSIRIRQHRGMVPVDPRGVRPRKDQPFYHLFAENAETEYIAYVSEQIFCPTRPASRCAIRRSPRCSSRTKGQLPAAQSRADDRAAVRSFLLSAKKEARQGAPLRQGSYAFGGACSRASCALLGAPLQLVLQLLLLLLEHLRIGRRAVIGLGEIAERHRQADRLAGSR